MSNYWSTQNRSCDILLKFLAALSLMAVCLTLVFVVYRMMIHDSASTLTQIQPMPTPEPSGRDALNTVRKLNLESERNQMSSPPPESDGSVTGDGIGGLQLVQNRPSQLSSSADVSPLPLSRPTQTVATPSPPTTTAPPNLPASNNFPGNQNHEQVPDSNLKRTMGNNIKPLSYKKVGVQLNLTNEPALRVLAKVQDVTLPSCPNQDEICPIIMAPSYRKILSHLKCSKCKSAGIYCCRMNCNEYQDCLLYQYPQFKV